MVMPAVKLLGKAKAAADDFVHQAAHGAEKAKSQSENSYRIHLKMTGQKPRRALPQNKTRYYLITFLQKNKIFFAKKKVDAFISPDRR